MPSTYTLISSNVLSSSAASVTFSAIPSTYTDLVLRWSARDVSGAANYDIQCEFNGSGGTAYSTTQVYGNGSSAFSNFYSSAAYGRTGYSESSDSTASTFSNDVIYIPSYTASQNKPFSSAGATENNSTTSRVLVSAMASLWRDTSAITSIKLSSGGTFAIGSSFYLYGIKNS
jgi:hypothetical protein